MEDKNRTYNQFVLGGCGVIILAALLVLVGTFFLLADLDRKNAQYPGSTLISSHSNYKGLPLEFLWDDSYLTADNFTAVYNWYSITFDLGSEARAAERCILLEGTNTNVAISRHISVFLCNTPGGQMVYVTRSTWFTGRSTILASLRDLQSFVSIPRP